MTPPQIKTGTNQHLSCKLEAQRHQDFRLVVEPQFIETLLHFWDV